MNSLLKTISVIERVYSVNLLSTYNYITDSITRIAWLPSSNSHEEFLQLLFKVGRKYVDSRVARMSPNICIVFNIKKFFVPILQANKLRGEVVSGWDLAGEVSKISQLIANFQDNVPKVLVLHGSRMKSGVKFLKTKLVTISEYTIYIYLYCIFISP